MKKYLLHIVAATALLFGFSGSLSAQTPVYVTSWVEKDTPTILEIFYNVNLANIVPATSAFSVQVNAVSRTVTSVAIGGNRVRLNLSSKIVYGDNITVSYTKPVSNPLQAVTGEQAASIASKSVTNYCPSTPFTDSDGNTFNSVAIGTQIWMAENLKTTKYNDGTAIPNVTDNTTWAGLTSPAYCWYNNDEATYKALYGALYDWYTVDAASNGGKNLCPTLWHVPNDDEWTTLETYLGGASVAGGKLKETGTTHWQSPNTGATNESGFTALPGGYRYLDGNFSSFTVLGIWWSSSVTLASPSEMWARSMIYNSTLVGHAASSQPRGFSVRCLRNVPPAAVITGTATVCKDASQPDITFTGITGTAPFTFTYTLNGGGYQVVTTTSGNSATVSVPTGTAGTYTYSIVSVQDVYSTTAQTGSATVTVNSLPTATTTSATAVASASAMLNGTVNANNTSTDVTFEYGTSQSYGSSVAAIPSPVTGTNNTIVSAKLTGLTANTPYHFRTVASSSGCISYGSDLTFTTSSNLTDADGNIYNTVVIGTQTWMQENLKTTKYRDGTNIPNITDNNEWSNLTSGASSDYSNLSSNSEIYGKLYNWFTLKDGHYLCPTGWHVPTDAEWGVLTDYLGGASVAGDKLKEAGTIHWLPSNPGATNESGFSALPGGGRVSDGQFEDISYSGYFWSPVSDVAWFRSLGSGLSTVGRFSILPNAGFSVRCLNGEGQVLPLVATTAVSAIASTTATSGGNVTSDGGSPITQRGVCWNTSANPTISNSKTSDDSGPGLFTSSLTGLDPNTVYYFRAYAMNSMGIAYGNEISFTTSGISTPTVTTNAINNITPISASCGGNVISDGGANVTTVGICWNTSQNPTIADNQSGLGFSGTGSFTRNVTDLDPNTTYYVRAYATNSAGTAYDDQVSFTTSQIFDPIIFNPGLTYPKVTDIDGNVYNTIQIGTQIWTAENLKTTKLNDGTDIPTVTDNTAWSTLTNPAFCWYKNNATVYKDIFGALYNWYTVNTGKLCPAGWHVPTHNEYLILASFLDGNSGGKLKEVGLTHWTFPNEGATNESGFTAIPSGYRDLNGSFDLIGEQAYWWSGTVYNNPEQPNSSYFRYLMDSDGSVHGMFARNVTGFSVRCVMNDLPTVTTSPVNRIASNSAWSGGTVTQEGMTPVTTRGICWNTSSNPTITGPHTVDVNTGPGSYQCQVPAPSLIPTSTYYLRAFATNGAGTVYGNEITFTTPDTITDADHNIYNTLVIGTQIWMQENLRTTKYRNGESILNGLNAGDYHREPAPKYYFSYNDDDANIATYGRYYTWYAATDTRKVCPTGWHVPTQADWNVFLNYLIGNGYGFEGGNHVGKSVASTSGWLPDPTSGNIGNDPALNNSSGFNGQPGGNRNYMYDNPSVKFYGMGIYGRFQSSNEYDSTSSYTGRLDANSPDLTDWADGKKHGFNIRCLMGEGSLIIYMPTLTTAAVSGITATSAISGGTVATDGSGTVTARGVIWSTNLNPTVDLATKTTDGNGPGAFSSTITGLTPGTTYYVRAYATNSAGTGYGSQYKITTYKADAITDVEGNYYNIVNIGSQVWMAENLKTTKYNNGTDIPLVTDNTSWSNLVTPGYCWYNNDEETYKNTYGALYSWYTVGSGNLCPTGWHIPTDVEWTGLTGFLGINAGGKLKENGLTHWTSPNEGATNESGFTALPGGYRNSLGSFDLFGTQAYWWANSVYENPDFPSYAWFRYLMNTDGNANRMFAPNRTGLSVRCLKDYPNPTIVTNLADDGIGSLRNALNYTNLTIGVKEIITFEIPGYGPFTIRPVTPLPAITDPVVIDGFSQPGASSTSPVLLIEIDGTNAGTGSNGLTINGGGSTVRGVIINRFSGAGIQITGSGDNSILGNFIGVDFSGTVPKGNTGDGIQILNGSSNNKIGGANPGEGNVISGNNGAGISIQSNGATGNLISSNSIYSNGGIGIDLGGDGITSDDTGDPDAGPNKLQNFPVLTSVSFSTGSVSISVSLNSEASTSYNLQFFASKLADNSGNGEGQTYLGSKTLTTSSTGDGVFTQDFAIKSSWGTVITAIATDPLGNTSEFSKTIGGFQDQTVGQWPLIYTLNKDGVPNITDGSDLDAVRASFQSWSAISTANIQFTEAGTTTSNKYANASDGVNLVSFEDDQFPFSYGVLAVAAKTLKIDATTQAARIIDADIVVNPDFVNDIKYNLGVLGTGNNSGYFDIQSVITHEIGHILGLLHSGVVSSTMFFTLNSGTKVRTLEQDDKSWASYGYPKQPLYNSTYGSISGNITYGYGGQAVAGALVYAISASRQDSVHGYSDASGNYTIPGLLPGSYNIYIEPLDGDVNGYNLRPANISSYIYSNTVYTDYPGEFYNSSDQANEPDDSKLAVAVSAGSLTSGIDLITNTDNIRPTVVSVSSTDVSASLINILSNFSIKFSEAIDEASLSTGTCFLTAGNKTIGGSYSSLGENVVLFDPESVLEYSTVYTLHITSGVKDLRGNPLLVLLGGLEQTEFTQDFTTISQDSDPPKINEVIPANAATNVFVTDKIRVFFSEPMNKTSVENGFTLSWTDANVLKTATGTFSWEDDNTSFAYTPTASLRENTVYTIKLLNSITDLSGNNLVQSQSSFTTVAQAQLTIQYLGPGNNNTSVPVTTPVVVDFSEPVNTYTVNSGTFRLLLGNIAVPGTFEFLNENSRVVFRPDENLNFSQTYSINLTEGIQDVSQPTSSNLSASNTTFTTAARITVPNILYLEPSSGVVGNVVTINGTGFDPDPLKNKITFNGIPAPVKEATLTSLITEVPMGAMSGPVEVTVSGTVSGYPMYFYIIPQTLDPCSDLIGSKSTGTNSSHDADVTEAVTVNGVPTSYAYVTNPEQGTVTVVNLTSTEAVKSIPVGKTPMKIDINPQGTRAYVTNFNSHNVSVIDLVSTSQTYNKVIKTIPVGIEPYGIAVTPNGKRVYVANYYSGNLSVIDEDPNSGGFDHVVANVSTGSSSSNVTVTADAGMVLVTGEFGLKIVNSNPADKDYNSVIANVSTGSKANDVTASADAGLAIVSTEDGRLMLINLHPENGNYSDAVIANVSTGTKGSGTDASGDNLFVYLTDTEHDQILVYQIGIGGSGTSDGSGVTGLTLIPHSKIPLGPDGKAPVALAISADASKLYVIDTKTGTSDRQITSIAICCGPISPQKAIGDLIITIQNMINNGKITKLRGYALIVLLNSSLRDIYANRPKLAILDLNLFKALVNTYIKNKQISSAQGNALINSANAIIARLNGTKASMEESYFNDVEQLNRDLIPVSRLGVIYPNPFSQAITINYQIADNKEEVAKVQIMVYDVSGRLVSTLVDKMMQQGCYTASWNGIYDDGGQAPYGTYFVLFRAGTVEEAGKIMLIKPR